MGLSKQRKLSLGVLAAAIAALAADRLFLGAAAPAAAGAAPVATPPGEGATSPAPVEAGVTLASRLEEIAGEEDLTPEGVKDLFADADAPLKWHLTTTFGAGPSASVRIDDRIVRVGESYGGAVLVAVTAQADTRGAVFRRGGQEFFIPMAKPGEKPVTGAFR